MLVESTLLKALGVLGPWTRLTHVQAPATLNGRSDSLIPFASPEVAARLPPFSSSSEQLVSKIHARSPDTENESSFATETSFYGSSVSSLPPDASESPVVVTQAADPSCSPQPYDITPIPSPSLPQRDPALAAVYRYRKQAGVNLGSWFLLEGWMVPSLFSCASDPAISEYDVASGWNGHAKAALERHWDSFITEDDFAWLSGIGINTVRLPIGYWHVGADQDEWNMGTAYEPLRMHYTGAWPRILRAVNWAAKHNIGVLLDLHAAPGSQNGQHHSGVSDGQTGLFNSPDNVKKTVALLKYLTSTFVDVPNVVGIQLLNEPLNVPALYDFYNTALDALRALSPEAKSFPFYLHDAFDINRGADFVRSRGSEWTVLDHHSYFVFTPDDNAKAASAHSADIASSGYLGAEMSRVGQNLNGNLITGEWSCALSDTSLAAEPDSISARRQFCETQKQTYGDVGSGYSFWSYKKENCDQDPSWCFRNAVGNALPSSFFSYDGQTCPQNLYLAIGIGLPGPSSVTGQGGQAMDTPPTTPTSSTVLASSQIQASPEGISEAATTPAPSNEVHDDISNSGNEQFRDPAAQKATQRMLERANTHQRSAIRASLPPDGSVSYEDIHAQDVSHTYKIDMVKQWHSRDHRARKIHERKSRSFRAQARRDGDPLTVPLPSETFSGILQDASTDPMSSLSSEPPTVADTQPTGGDGSPPLSPAHQAIQRGFSDGFMTAKLFAQQAPGMSRLGFKWQYVEDSLRAHGPSIIVPGKEGYYREWFDKGLIQGEAMVAQVIARMNAA